MTNKPDKESLQRAIAQGVYVVPALDVADAILDRWTLADVVREWHTAKDQPGSAVTVSDEANR
jgi:hypothetical protein